MEAASPDFNHGQSGFHEAADVLPDLSVGLGCLSEVVPHLLVGFIHHPLLLVGRTPRRAATGEEGGHTFSSLASGKERCFYSSWSSYRLIMLIVLESQR